MKLRPILRIAREFSTPEAMKKYLQEHPKADKSKHFVQKAEKSAPKSEGETSKPKKSGGLFSAKEVAKLPEVATQKSKDPDTIFKEAEVAAGHQLTWLNQGKGLDKAIGGTVIRKDKGDEIDYDKPGPIIVIGGMKKKERAGEKVESDYGGDWSRLGDIVRSSVAVDSMGDLKNVVSELKKSGLKLARKPKDRFENPTEAGYRDIIMNVVHKNGHVGEIQLHLKPILKAKSAGHKFYEEVRSIEAKAKKEGRTDMTPEERSIVDAANQKMKDLYEGAMGEATKPKKKTAAMERAAAAKKYYDLDGVPAYWKDGKFPVVVTPSGKERVVYDIEDFFFDATPISESEFAALKKESGKK